jgi:hypothetical protein
LLRALRWLIIAVVLAVGLVLVAHGHLLIGSLLCGLAALRIAYLFAFASRRRTARARWNPAPQRLLLHGLRQREVGVAAATIGAEPAELRREFAGGRSIAEIAVAAGVAPERLISAVIADAGAALDRSLADGTATSDAVALAKADLPRWATRLVHATRNDLRGALPARRADPLGRRGW